MTEVVEQYLAVSVLYIFVCCMVLTNAVPSKVGKYVLAIMFSVVYGYLTYLFAVSANS